jgi:hypothetical protein
MGEEQAMMKKVLAAGVAGAAALGGLALLGTGGAGAAKPALSGTLHCNVNTTTSFVPGAVLSLNQLPKPKDKKIKVLGSTTYSGCTGSEPTSGLPVPTSGTQTSKAKNPSRLCTSLTSLPAGKSKYLFGGTHKSKGGLPGSTISKADNGTPANLADDVAIPAATDPGFNAFIVAHGSDGTVSVGSGGTLAGKAYANKSTNSISHSGSLLQKLNACLSPTGMTTVVSTGTLGIGVPA